MDLHVGPVKRLLIRKRKKIQTQNLQLLDYDHLLYLCATTSAQTLDSEEFFRWKWVTVMAQNWQIHARTRIRTPRSTRLFSFYLSLVTYFCRFSALSFTPVVIIH